MLMTGEKEFVCKNCGLKFKNPYKRIKNPNMGDPAPLLRPSYIKLYSIIECPKCKSKNIVYKSF